MSSNSRIVVFVCITLMFCGCVQLQNSKNPDNNLIKKDFKYKTFAHEDRYIMYALEYERQNNKTSAKKLYLKLYDETLKEEYLFEYLKHSFSLSDFDEVINKTEEYRNKIVKNEDKILRVYILSLIQKKEYEKALVEINSLLKKYKTDLNYELLGNVYLHKKEYKKSKEVFAKTYSNSLSSGSLLNLTNVMYIYLDEKKEAINYLESHRKLYGCNNKVCSKLLSYYQEQKNIDGIISILKKTYYNFKEHNNTLSVDNIYKLLMYYLEKKDIKEAILFLEHSAANDEKLFTLYRSDHQLSKALKLARQFYKKSGNINYLAQIAMLEFETAKDKRIVLKDVIKKFEDVLSVLDSHIYQNYLGYILIDFDVDIEKGLKFVNSALEKAPNNLAYIDSLAWGQYKIKDCKNAIINMKKVVDGAGLNDKEIKIHWNKIKECNK